MSFPKTVEVYKLTVRDFHALFPLLDPDLRHELLDGQIYVMPIPGTPHTRALDRLRDQFRDQRRPGLHVWSGGLILGEHDEVLPDLTLLEAEPPESVPTPAAAAAKLVVEVSDTTLHRDTHAKLRAYRQAGVAEYWVVDVAARRVLRHLAPGNEAEAFAGSETPLRPGAYPDLAIDVGALFS
jgi:Uma2 family endonuclease